MEVAFCGREVRGGRRAPATALLLRRAANERHPNARLPRAGSATRTSGERGRERGGAVVGSVRRRTIRLAALPFAARLELGLSRACRFFGLLEC